MINLIYDMDDTLGASVVPGYHRVLIKVGGYNAFYTTFTRSGVRQNIAAALDARGIGYESINDSSPYAVNPSYNEFTIAVVAVDGQNDESVRTLVLSAVGSALTSATATVVTGQPTAGGSVSSVLGNLALGAGISTPIIIVGALVLLVLIKK